MIFLSLFPVYGTEFLHVSHTWARSIAGVSNLAIYKGAQYEEISSGLAYSHGPFCT